MENVAQAIRDFVNNSLGVNPIEMVIQIASTLLLFLVVKHFFWKNITDYLEKRQAAMTQEYDQAKLANEEAQTVKEQASSELHEIRTNAKNIVEEAKERGESERQVIVSKAKQEANKLIENAHIEINSEIEKARSNMNNEIVNVAALMAEKIIQKEIDMKAHKEIIDNVTKEVAN